MVKVALSELHGIAQESVKNPPVSVRYCEAKPSIDFITKLIKSPAKGVLDYFDKSDYDFIEAPLFPIRTKCDWIYTPADTATAMAFNLLGLPTPRLLRELYLRNQFEKKNFKALLFKSYAGLKTLDEYPVLKSQLVESKAGVLYPAVRVYKEVKRENRKYIQFVFVGEFFRKGGIHVVNAFERLQQAFNNLKLVICANENIHFNHELKDLYLDKIHKNKDINLQYVSRDVLFSEILPSSDIFVSPTYYESFGYALLEAMALGLPVIATNYFAIPEIVDNHKTGLLIDTSNQEFIAKSKGYTARNIPQNFIEYMDREVYAAMKVFIDNPELRRDMGKAGRKKAISKFSFEKRNKILEAIYLA